MGLIKVSVDLDNAEILNEKYGEELVDKIEGVIEKYTKKVREDAKKILLEQGRNDTGNLRSGIRNDVLRYVGKITGEVSTDSGTKHAKFIHDGVMHKDEVTVKPFFVSFRGKNATLLAWAIKHGIIKEKSGSYYYIDKNKKEHKISNIEKSGIRVHIKPSKFFEKPFNEVKDKFVEDMSKLVGGI